ncbi:MAG: 2-C-methyl-D-erythritol 2,4-cyclodiphosphate synthase [Abyssibacter sp.]|uniref:2-C-methyl-D-erythritol 2,4-cyclodiphosphate synthase n=1 Tax=Abyssibacter sp. TaxID=2320200 RepID=UPI00321B43A0
MIRVGHGYDVHRFGEGDHVWLGGVRIAHSHGLIAHSDGDVLIHALSDALLGAVALGDIGGLFPDTSAQWAGLAGHRMLQLVRERLREQGYVPAQCDGTIIAQVPRIAPHVPAMRERIADGLGIAVGAVNVKATTTERLGPIGRKEGIAAHAVVTVAPL